MSSLSKSEGTFKRDQQLLKDRLFDAVEDYRVAHGFDELVTILGACVIAARTLEDAPPKPQSVIKRGLTFQDRMHKDVQFREEVLNPEYPDAEPKRI